MHQHISEHQIAITDSKEVIIPNKDKRSITAINLNPYHLVAEKHITDERLTQKQIRDNHQLLIATVTFDQNLRVVGTQNITTQGWKHLRRGKEKYYQKKLSLTNLLIVNPSR